MQFLSKIINKKSLSYARDLGILQTAGPTIVVRGHQMTIILVHILISDPWLLHSPQGYTGFLFLKINK